MKWLLLISLCRPLTPELSPEAQSSRPKLGTRKDSGGKLNRETSSASYDYYSAVNTSLVDVIDNAVANAEPSTSLKSTSSIIQQHVRLHPKSHTQISNDVYVDLVQEMMYGDGRLVAASKAAVSLYLLLLTASNSHYY